MSRTAASTVLERVSWSSVNDQVRQEQRNREVYVPPISLFRWWARRPHALIGALIDAAIELHPQAVVSDPFSGGGTVAMEAVRRGLTVYAQDLHPWAVNGLATVLDGVDIEELRIACDQFLQAVSERCGDLYATSCPRHGNSTLTHVFWVREKSCPTCNTRAYMYPYSLVTVASRTKHEKDGFFGCSACGHVSRHRLGTAAPRCGFCRRTLPPANEPLLADRLVSCRKPGCRASFPVFDGTTPNWTPVLVHRLCTRSGKAVSHFAVPTAEESSAGATGGVPPPLREDIPAGIETAVLHRAGFKTWADVFAPRQLRVLVECSDVIATMQVSDPVRARLRLVVCGAAEMAAYLSRWDRYYPKAFESMANHRFPALGLACETNLLSSRGRGTLRRRLDHSLVAATWASENLAVEGTARTIDSTSRRRLIRRGTLVAHGSSERQLPSNESIDLVLTDPPYFDDVQYAELASLFLATARATNLIPDSVFVDVDSEAVANAARGTGVEGYRDLLARIFVEARRTLKPRGRVILTYHNTDIRAWWALGRALNAAGLRVCALAVAEAENGSDHPKRGRNAFTSDLVIECLTSNRRGEPVTVGLSATTEALELFAAGRAVATAGSADLPDFIETYRRERGALASPRIRIPEIT